MLHLYSMNMNTNWLINDAVHIHNCQSLVTDKWLDPETHLFAIIITSRVRSFFISYFFFLINEWFFFPVLSKTNAPK